ncbi:MAG: hypothetical protein OCD02_06855 [Spirochaetaceae bacterium]
MTIDNIKKRNQIIGCIRNFFNSKLYLEVETPILSPSLIPESTIEIFETTHIHPFKKHKSSYLIPSPEIWLKRFIAEYKTNIYEFSKCFRNSEQTGKQHNPEFTMIEYYTMGYNHLDTLELTKELLNYLNSNIEDSKLSKTNKTITMEEAFSKYAGFSLKENHTIKLLHIKAQELNIFTDINDDWETAFNRIFLDIVEPNLPTDVNLFLTDFPSNIKTLAKEISGTPWSQRWELYIGGMECGNCYTEETDTSKIRRFFLEEANAGKKCISNHKIDMDYPELFNHFPECSGGAIGIDRLIMGILGTGDIQGVILFPYHDNI